MQKRLGVNIDHVATLREVRGSIYPSLIEAAKICEAAGAHQITCHLREDRRHVQDADLLSIKKNIHIPLNLEIASRPEMINFALKVKPYRVTLVPEKRQELTTEGGLNLKRNFKALSLCINQFIAKKIKVSLFVDPTLEAIQLSSQLNVDAIEIHTGSYANSKSKKKLLTEFKKIHRCARLAKKLKIDVFAGHGLTTSNLKLLTQIEEIEEYNIGHWIVARAVIVGLKRATEEILELLA